MLKDRFRFKPNPKIDVSVVFGFRIPPKRFTCSHHTTEETYHLSTRSSYLRPALCMLHDTNKAMISTPFVFLNLCFSTWTHFYAVYVDYLLFCLQSSFHAKKETKSSKMCVKPVIPIYFVQFHLHIKQLIYDNIN